MSNSTTPSKLCARCKLLKSTTEFGIDTSRPDNLHCYCKQCRRVETRERYAKLKNDNMFLQTHRESSALWYEKHKTERSALGKLRRQNNTQKSREKERIAWHKRNGLKKKAGGIFTSRDVGRQGRVQKWCCWWCGAPCQDAYHVDHLIPLAKGGHNDPSNIVITCPHCNLSKSDKLPEEWCGRLF